MLVNRFRRTAILGTVFALSALTGTALAAGPATAADPNSLPLSQVSVTGVHNTYNNPSYPFLAQALDSGTGMVELDTWTDVFTQEWKVSHDSPISNSNNCVNATTPANLETGGANKDLGFCLDDIRVWLDAHPTAGPIVVKVEMKNGFEADLGMGPSQFDSLVSAHLGSALFRPANLLGSFATLDAAAKANAWPTRAALAGKAIVYIIPGTVELANPFDTLHTDVEYATYLKNLAAADRVSQATTFPAVLGAKSGDPRTRYGDTTIRPWFVFFDGDAATYVGGIDTSFYSANHYMLTMTDAQNVTPTLSDTNPTVADAQARVAQLAADHASIVSSDWSALPTVLATVRPRG
ncbi:MAG TPA: phosphatidylinositol-specific phospholipase C domain-containing protein [Pseudonocardiaceae bacterium]|nr:phosphatidylinositol-specific phospholipase C domain-containing protein [Pseudonocardiaceae bacterium]